LWGRHFG